MLKFKFNVADALDRVGFSAYDAKKTGYIAQDTLRKLKSEDTRVALEAINKLCVILDMDIRDVIAWEMSEEDAEIREQIIKKCSVKAD